METISDSELDDFLDQPLPQEDKEETMASIPNTLMMAASDLIIKCIVCRKTIESGDSFIYCINCGKPGHYRHLGEMIKVTGKCPSCKKRLVLSMYDFE